MRYLISLLIGLIIAIVLFGAFTFFELTPDISKWGEGARYMYVVCSLCAIAFPTLLTYLNDDTKK